jgi:HD superfamily phosphodiesterase
MIEKVREYVIETYEKSNRIEDYKYHISVVEEICANLAKRFNIDEEILRISALLHEIGKIKVSFEETEKVLEEFNLEREKIEKIKKILKEYNSYYYSYDKQQIPISLETKILKIADAYSHFKEAIYLPYLYIKYGNVSIEEAFGKTKEMLERDLKFLKEIDKEIDIKDIVKECQEIYEFFCKFI